MMGCEAKERIFSLRLQHILDGCSDNVQYKTQHKYTMSIRSVATKEDNTTV